MISIEEFNDVQIGDQIKIVDYIMTLKMVISTIEQRDNILPMRTTRIFKNSKNNSTKS